MSRSPLSAKIDSAALQQIAQLVDNEDFVDGLCADSHLELLPVSPGCFHANWRVDQESVDAGRQMLGVSPESVRLVLRAYEFEGVHCDYAQARSEDFPVQGLDNHGYFDLKCEPLFVGGVLGLVNGQGHFRPILRSESVALPQAVAKTQPATPAKRGAPAAPGHSLNEREVLARLPRLMDLPAELLMAPEELAAIELTEDRLIEAASVELAPTPALDESTVHDAVIRGTGKVLPEPITMPATLAKPSTERTGSSELLASQWSDHWDDLAPIHLRAELSVSGRLGPGLKLTLGGQVIRPLPGGYFKVVRKLNAFAEAWPLFSTISLQEKLPDDATRTLQNEAGQVVLEIHTSIFLEGRINDPDYLKFLPEGVSPDAGGRFSAHRSLPNGAVLLPGLSLLADA